MRVLARRRAFVLGCIAVLATAACTSDAESRATGREAAVSVDEGWALPTPPVTNISALYFRLENEGPLQVRLVGATSPRCTEIELHRTVNTEAGDGRTISEMREVDELVADPGESLELAPNGAHLMCLGLDEPLVSGDTFDVQLRLEQPAAEGSTAVPTTVGLSVTVS